MEYVSLDVSLCGLRVLVGSPWMDGDYATGTASPRNDIRIGVVLDLYFEVGHVNFSLNARILPYFIKELIGEMTY
jgi:hypothetical protein